MTAYRNPNCDGSGPCSHGQPARLSTASPSSSSGLYLCRACWAREIQRRRTRNQFVAYPFDLPEFPTP